MTSQPVDIPLEDLPYWMRQARRGWDWAALLVVGFCLLAALPFIAQPGLPQASENYVFLTNDYSEALREGRLYPRWSPNVLSGYGAPIPNFFPPAAPYIAALIKVLFTNDAVLAVQIVFVLGFILAGVSTYTFVRRRTNALAGLLAAVLYLYSPYFGHLVPYVRGDMAVFVALALLPALFWTTDRLVTSNRRVDLPLTGLAFALLILTHPGIALTALILGTALLIACHIAGQKVPWTMVLLSGLVGIGFAAFYWIPALYERGFVYWIERVPSPVIRLDTLLAPLQLADPAALIPNPVLTLGLALPVIALITTITAAIDAYRRLFKLLFLATSLITLLIAVWFMPSQHWLLGIASLLLAIGGSTALLFELQLVPFWTAAYRLILFGIALLGGLSSLLVPPFPTVAVNLEPISQLVYEQRRFGIAVLPPDALLPSPLPALPATNRLLLSAYETQNINKLTPPQTANRSRINLISHESHRDRFQITTETPLTLNLLTAYYPGWTATAAGNPIELRQDPLTGLSLLEIPPMNGELVVEFGTTPVRTAAWLVTLGTVVIALGITWRRVQRDPAYYPDSNFLTPLELRAMIVILLGFTAAALFFTSPDGSAALYRPPGSALDSAQSLRHRSDAGLEVLAYRLAPGPYQPGDKIRVTLYWQTIVPLANTYKARLRLVNSDGAAVYISAYRSPGYFPTSRWRSYLYVADYYEIPVPVNSPSPEYTIALEVYNCNPDCTEGLTFFDSGGRNIGQTSYLSDPIQVQAQD